MAGVITFKSRKFDVSAETPNPNNPIFGQSVLAWLAGALRSAGYQVAEPEPEDWGWYVDVRNGEVSYLLGASAELEEAGAPVEWTLQVDRHRSAMDRLRGRGKLTEDDALCVMLASLLKREPLVADLRVE